MNRPDLLDEAALRDARGGTKTPKYLSLYNELFTFIAQGKWKPGDKLPSEVEIARTMPFSLGTVQKALRMLSDNGVIVRRHGFGTFVAGARAPEEQARNFRFLDDDGGVLPLYALVVAIEATQAKGSWSEFMAGANEFVKIARVVNVNFEFKTYSQLYLPIDRFGSLLNIHPHALEAVSFNQLLGQQFNVPTTRTIRHLRGITIDAQLALEIGVTANTLGWRLEIFGYTLNNAPISFQFIVGPHTSRRLELGE